MHHLIVSTLIVIILLLFGLGCCHLLDLLAPGWARKGDVPFHGNQTDVEQGRARLLDPAAMRSHAHLPAEGGGGEAAGGFLAPLMRIFSGEPPPFSSTAALFAGSTAAAAPQARSTATASADAAATKRATGTGAGTGGDADFQGGVVVGDSALGAASGPERGDANVACAAATPAKRPAAAAAAAGATTAAGPKVSTPAGTGGGAGGFAPAAVERSGRGRGTPAGRAGGKPAGRGRGGKAVAGPSSRPPDVATEGGGAADGDDWPAPTPSPSQLAAAEVAAVGGGAAAVVVSEAAAANRFNLRAKRTMSAKLKAEQLATILAEQKQQRASAKKRAEEEAARTKRLRAYETTISSLWESQWEYVLLTRLPADNEKADERGRRGVSERHPELADQLAQLLQHFFSQLFDIYLFYAKVEADAAASELYRMTDFNWKSLLRDATVVGESREAGQLTTQEVTAIFKTVNQRRDNLTQNKGKEAKALNAGERATDDKPAAYTEAALKVIVEAPGGGAAIGGGGYSGSVTKPHYAAGSLYAFTFSEFLEGLIHVALQLPPNASGMVDRDPNGLTPEYVLQQVHWLIHDRVLPNVKHGEVLEFRRMIVGSALIASALEAVSPMLEPVYEKFAMLPSKGKYTGSTGCSLKAFLEMCQDAQLVGSQLSHVNVKTAFVNSLSLAADTDAARKPLLDRAEFVEAVIRMAHKYKPETDQLPLEDSTRGDGARASVKGVRAARKAAESAAKPVKGHKDAAIKLADTVKSKLPAAEPPAAEPPAGWRADWSAALAPAGAEDAKVKEQRGEDEAAILLNLPVVCGKLLSLLDKVDLDA